jgi:hypothetical protein
MVKRDTAFRRPNPTPCTPQSTETPNQTTPPSTLPTSITVRHRTADMAWHSKEATTRRGTVNQIIPLAYPLPSIMAGDASDLIWPGTAGHNRPRHGTV